MSMTCLLKLSSVSNPASVIQHRCIENDSSGDGLTFRHFAPHLRGNDEAIDLEQFENVNTTYPVGCAFQLPLF